jgi:stringent starvation protein B
MEYVKNGEIVLNISFGATSGLKMDNDAIRFHARFGGVSREIFVPVNNVIAIYASENGQGMAFEACWAWDAEPKEPEDSAPTLSLAPRPALRQPQSAPSSTPDDDGTPPKGRPPHPARIK